MELLTIPKISSLIGVPESNLRYYRSKFDKYLPEVADGKHRRYKPEAIEIFKFIAESFKSGASSEYIEQELQNHFAMTITPEDDDPQQIDATKQQMDLFRTMMMESVREVVREEIATMRNELSAMNDIREEIAATRNELSSTIENKIDGLIIESRKEKHKKKGFFQNLFSK